VEKYKKSIPKEEIGAPPLFSPLLDYFAAELKKDTE
jgi:hypothetical protein